ncbi:MAG: hypothetical protein V3T00_01755, partial [bacterium]
FGSADAEDVEGEYAVVAGGVSAVIDLAPSKIMLGGGIFNAAADFRGTIFGVPFDSDVSLTGILFDGRWDYTFEGGFYLGVGLHLGIGAASGTLTEGADTATGSLFMLYVPLGFTF